MTIDIGIPESARIAVAEKLNVFLATSYMVRVKTQNFHWNVEGPHFPMLHSMFEDQYDTLSGSIDEVAERVRMLGERSVGSMQEFIKHSLVEEATVGGLTEHAMLTQLHHDHEVLIKSAREFAEFAGAQGDVGNEDFFTSRIQMHEKVAWMLRATLNAKNM
ncbi:MAG: DNA starvation/stationary phase protection protein [Deltaproteobacteria bacterium]|nr:DNA starvation/stationary phase protection protein [Deltaproteobacteria bacterium]